MEAGIALCGEASLDVRINSLMTTRDVVMERMKRVGVTATPTKWSAEGLHVEREGFEASTWENLGLLQVGRADCWKGVADTLVREGSCSRPTSSIRGSTAQLTLLAKYTSFALGHQ